MAVCSRKQVGQMRTLGQRQRHYTTNRVFRSVCYHADNLRQQQDDDCILVEPSEEDWIFEQLRGGPDSHTPGRRYFNIPYVHKDNGKMYGACWDDTAREWCSHLLSCSWLIN